MTSDLEDGEIEDFESVCTPEKTLGVDGTLPFVYMGDDLNEQIAKRSRHSSSPYSPTTQLSPIQLDQDDEEVAMEVKQSSRVVGGYWAPLSSAVKKAADLGTSDLLAENNDIILISSTSENSNFDSLLKKYRNIRQGIAVDQREEEQNERISPKKSTSRVQVGPDEVKEGEEDELAEMQLRLAALESTLQRTQTRTADCLQRGELELSRNEVEEGELVDDEGELEEDDADNLGGEDRGKDANSSKSSSQRSSRRSSVARKIFSPKREKVVRSAHQTSSRRSSSNRSTITERRRSSNDRDARRLSSSKKTSRSSQKKRTRRSDSGERVSKRERLNLWQQQQREKILSTRDPDAQMKEFYRMLTTTSFNMTATTAASNTLDSSRRSTSRDATALSSSCSVSTARADLVDDNYDLLNMDIASDTEQRSPEEAFPEVPPPPGVSPPVLDLVTAARLSHRTTSNARRSDEPAQPSPPPRPPSDEPTNGDAEDDEDADMLRLSLLAQVQKKRKDSPTPELLSKTDDVVKKPKTATKDTRVVIAPNTVKSPNAAPSRVPIRLSERSIQYRPNLVKTIANVDRHVVGIAGDGQLKITMPVPFFESSTVTEIDSGAKNEQAPVDQLLNQMLKDTRKRTDQVKASKQQQVPPANFAALEERLKSCEEDVKGHRVRVQEDRVRLRSLQALDRRHKLERRKAVSRCNRLIDLLAASRIDVDNHERILARLDPEINLVKTRVSANERVLADFEKQWNEIQAFVAKRKGVPLQEKQQSHESISHVRREQLQAVKATKEKNVARLNPSKSARVVEQDSRVDEEDWVQNPLMAFGGYRLSPLFPSRLLSSVTYSNRLDCHVPLCPFALSGRCADDTCPWQHDHDYRLSEQQLVASVVAHAPSLLSENESCLEFAARALKERRPSQTLDAFLQSLLDTVPDEQQTIHFEISESNSPNRTTLSAPEVEVPFYRVPVLSSQVKQRYFVKKNDQVVGE